MLAALGVTACEDDTPDGGAGEEGNNAPNNAPNNAQACGDGVCGPDESAQSCPDDCGAPPPQCGDGACEAGEDAQSCPDDCAEDDGPVCGDGQCDEGEDNTSCPDDCDAPGPVCGDGQCDEGEDNANCPDDCEAPPECEPGPSRCLDPQTQEDCVDGVLVQTSCEVGFVCQEGACTEVVCSPGEVAGCASRDELLICNENGTGSDPQPCEEGAFCDFVNGTFVCTNQICPPGEIRCRGLLGVEQCSDDGTQWVPGEDCEEATQCDNGECKSLCEINSKVSSFLGCEYWSVDLDNITGGLNASHAVIISNPSTELAAEITVTRPNGDPVYVTGWPTEVPPGELATWRFDTSAVNSLDNTDLLDTAYIDGTMLGDQSFRFESSIPTTAHQFNPLVDRNVFTNDASLLLPTNAIGTNYLVMSWKHRGAGFQLHGNFTIIAVTEGTTTVTITPTAAVNAGTNKLTNTPIERIPAGETREFVLEYGQVLNLESEGPEGTDLTGSEIITDQPTVAFGGHECANVPLGFDACDHIEQQLIPVDAWGTRYIGTRFEPRNNQDQEEVWRILAGQDNVTLTTRPAIANVDGVTLNRGEFVEFQSGINFELEATGPILPAQYITGTNYQGAGRGDPAMTLLVPIEQWRRDYIVLTPPAYNQGDFLNVTAPAGTTVLLDGVPIEMAEFEAIEDSEYMTARLEVEDGPHTLSSAEPFTVIAYGYDSAVSYAYPGGLNLEDVR